MIEHHFLSTQWATWKRYETWLTVLFVWLTINYLSCMHQSTIKSDMLRCFINIFFSKVNLNFFHFDGFALATWISFDCDQLHLPLVQLICFAITWSGALAQQMLPGPPKNDNPSSVPRVAINISARELLITSPKNSIKETKAVFIIKISLEMMEC